MMMEDMRKTVYEIHRSTDDLRTHMVRIHIVIDDGRYEEDGLRNPSLDG